MSGTLSDAVKMFGAYGTLPPTRDKTLTQRKLFFLGAVALVALTLSGCATPKRGMTRLEVLTLLLEIDQRDQNGMKPSEKTDLLAGEIALERIHDR